MIPALSYKKMKGPPSLGRTLHFSSKRLTRSSDGVTYAV